MDLFDCAIIGAGPAGLSASLVLGRSRRKIALFDNGTNRNQVTQESHGFLTRDGIKPEEFREIGLKELKNYPSVQYHAKTVTNITKQSSGVFTISTLDNQKYSAEKVVLAAGIQEIFPKVPNIKQYYGKSLFSCPYCDGWELRDQPLIIICDNEDYVMHMGKLIYNWTKDLVIATNGLELSSSIMNDLRRKNISVMTEPIKKLCGEDGYLNKVEFASGYEIQRTRGFIVPSFFRPNQFAEHLHCEVQNNGVIETDESGRTSQKNVYSAGETSALGPSSLMIAAGEGNKTAVAVNMDLINERF
ncbi:NAD(P)/FAD-dependent oxidoreductase [Chengkuizengella axinellae]|uniref:NAD(P)/FAD-dependent oxidoreductase n=1 Tax=Chengkuizengella axinellae TaxID=3064388 RepID=A0ABT9J3T5_9BACL|nr:NAD(P)/FAD-dependent oxidoreductase [Chengkuizengella sp. 2205SS18-9]MDP5275639.1 NAD(P)/FAD-dependent oxidoreductase [Chengkuizengella sp. 2205SS18-9]